MLKRFKALLPKLPIILPVATIGMLLFSEMPDPISSLLSKSEEEKEEELNLEMASKKEEGGSKDKGSPDGKGKNPEAKGDEGKGDGESERGEKGKDKGEGQGEKDIQGSQKGTENGAEDGSVQGALNLDLGLNGDSADGAGGSDNVAKEGLPEEQDALGDSGLSNGGAEGDREQGEESGSVISGQGRDGEEKKEVQRKPALGGPRSFAPVFRSLIGDIRSESFA